MLSYWPLLLALFGPLITAAVVCIPELGRAIRGTDCGWALGILQTRLTLFDPRALNLEHAQQPFVLNSNGDPRFKMPQGASFGTCGVGIDIAPAPRSMGSWGSLISEAGSIFIRCARQGLGGTSELGHFKIIVVDAGQGMQNLRGTCMSPTPSAGLPLLWQMKERFCGFRSVAALFPSPNTSQLPLPPSSLFPMGLVMDIAAWVPYRVRGQWVWNADTWSPIIGNALNQAASRAIWVLVAGGGPRGSDPSLPPFSRTIPRVMGAAWFRQQNQPLRHVRGAWGARGATWIPLTGDLADLQSLINNFDWLLVEIGTANEGADDTVIPRFGPLQPSVPRSTQAQQPVPGSGQRPPFGFQGRTFYPASQQGQTINPGSGRGRGQTFNLVPGQGQRQLFGPGFGQGRIFNSQGGMSYSGLRQGQSFLPVLPGIGQPRISADTNQTAAASIDRLRATASVEGAQQSVGAVETAPEASSDNLSTSTLSDDDDDDGTRPSKRPRPATSQS